MSKAEEQAREIVHYITRGRGAEVLVVLPNVGALANMSNTILALCDRIGLDQYRVRPGGRTISFDNGARINFQSLYPDAGSKVKVPPHLFKSHNDAGKAVLDFMRLHDGVDVIAVAHERPLAQHAFRDFCDCAQRHAVPINYRAGDLQVVLENQSRLFFYHADYVAEGMIRGRRFDAYWMLAPYLWRKRDSFIELEERMREDVKARFESYR
jgi:hypothetical protein